ncbi:MAG: hypothetical protein QOE00_1985 [Ilumatobacteraceae bacterium]|jgi:hypothetical protein
MGWSAVAGRRTVAQMTTLHIEHPITDFSVWSAAFDRFAEARRQAGVRAQRVQRPVDDDRYVMIDLDFDDIAAAQRFLSFLQANVWAAPESSPGLAGTPVTRFLEPAPEGHQPSSLVTSTATTSS